MKLTTAELSRILDELFMSGCNLWKMEDREKWQERVDSMRITPIRERLESLFAEEDF